MGLSVVIHTYNSGKYLEKCLESVKMADEIIICDMYSTDGTIQIAEKYGCKIIYHENIGYADPARNWAMNQAKNEWIFVLDSDEIAPKPLMDFLHEWIETDEAKNHFKGMYIPRKNIQIGKFLRAWYPNTIIRLFKKGHFSWPAEVHCSPRIAGAIYTINPKEDEKAIIHYNHQSIESFIKRMNTYTTLELNKFIQRGVKFSLWYLLLRPVGEFIKRYILKKGYKDGMHGFMFAIFIGIYKFFAIAKLWEYEYKKKVNFDDTRLPTEYEM